MVATVVCTKYLVIPAPGEADKVGEKADQQEQREERYCAQIHRWERTEESVPSLHDFDPTNIHDLAM